MTSPADQPDVVLRFRALPDPEGVPLGVRLRKLLRFALRQQRLRCVWPVEWVDVDEPEEKPSAGEGE